MKSRAEALITICGRSFSPRYTLTLPSSISITQDFLPGISEKVNWKSVFIPSNFLKCFWRTIRGNAPSKAHSSHRAG